MTGSDEVDLGLDDDEEEESLEVVLAETVDKFTKGFENLGPFPVCFITCVCS